MAWMAAISAGAGLASSLFGGSAKRAAQITQAGQQYVHRSEQKETKGHKLSFKTPFRT